jgi:hypothetical protein
MPMFCSRPWPWISPKRWKKRGACKLHQATWYESQHSTPRYVFCLVTFKALSRAQKIVKSLSTTWQQPCQKPWFLSTTWSVPRDCPNGFVFQSGYPQMSVHQNTTPTLLYCSALWTGSELRMRGKYSTARCVELFAKLFSNINCCQTVKDSVILEMHCISISWKLFSSASPGRGLSWQSLMENPKVHMNRHNCTWNVLWTSVYQHCYKYCHTSQSGHHAL